MGSSSASTWSSLLSSSSAPPTPGAASVEKKGRPTPGAASSGEKKKKKRQSRKKEAPNSDQDSEVNVTLTLRMPNDPALSAKACTSCGDTQTPLWRKGPQGRKTLCNACGIRYRKAMNKIRASLTLGTGPSGPGSVPKAGRRSAA